MRTLKPGAKRRLQREEEIGALNSPPIEALFYEIFRGFEVIFVKRNGELIAKIRNKEKNGIF
jgi:hypothetical protein